MFLTCWEGIPWTFTRYVISDLLQASRHLDKEQQLIITPQNLPLLSEFTTETGRIKTGKETGLRLRNQRRIAKAVRRAIGIGLMPSVYKHPELMAEKLGIKGYNQQM